MVNLGFGGIDQLRIVDREVPEPTDAQLLLKVLFSGVNHVDWQLREGWFRDAQQFTFPFVPGWDVCGTVADRGTDVRGFRPGDVVFGYCRSMDGLDVDGAYAEFVAVDAAQCHPVPTGLSAAAAASLPLILITAAQLIAAAGVVVGDRVLLLGGAGAVGGLVDQLLGVRSVEVRHVGRRELAADPATAQAAGTRGATGSRAVLDCGVGIDERTAAALGGPGTTLVSIVRPPDEELARQFGIGSQHVFARPGEGDLGLLSALIAHGRLAVTQPVEVPLAEAGTVHEYMRNGGRRRHVLHFGPPAGMAPA